MSQTTSETSFHSSTRALKKVVAILPDTPNANGKPLWEPPILDYFDLIGEGYFRKRKAMLEYTGQDVTMTTKLMNINNERLLLIRYRAYGADCRNSAGHQAVQDFFSSLENLIYDEIWDLEKEAAQYGKTQYLKTKMACTGGRMTPNESGTQAYHGIGRVICDTARPPIFGSPLWLSQWDVHHNSVPLAFRLPTPVSYWYRTTKDGFDLRTGVVMGCQPYSFLGRRDCGQDRSMVHPSYKPTALLKLLRRKQQESPPI